MRRGQRAREHRGRRGAARQHASSLGPPELSARSARRQFKRQALASCTEVKRPCFSPAAIWGALMSSARLASATTPASASSSRSIWSQRRGGGSESAAVAMGERQRASAGAVRQAGRGVLTIYAAVAAEAAALASVPPRSSPCPCLRARSRAWPAPCGGLRRSRAGTRRTPAACRAERRRGTGRRTLPQPKGRERE